MRQRLKNMGICILMLVLSVCLGTVSASAAEVDSGTCGADITWTLSDTGTLTLSGEGHMYDYAPGKSPFANSSAIKKVVIGRGILHVGSNVFDGCTKLTSVSFSFPSDIRSIDSGAFRGCTGLSAITLPRSLESFSTSIFEGCTKLTSISVDSSSMSDFCSDGGVVFRRDSSNTLALYPPGKSGAYTIPTTTTSIDDGAFFHCTGLTSVTIHKDVTLSYDYKPFIGCSALTSVTVNSSNSKLSSSNGVLFNKDKTKLILYPAAKSGTTYTVPNTVTEIEDGAFTGAAKLTKITFGSGITAVDNLDFAGCTSLSSFAVSSSNTAFTAVNDVLFSKDKTDLCRYPAGKSGAVTVPEGTTGIDFAAFADCAKLTSITLPASLTSINYDAFEGCSSLTNLYADADNEYFYSEDGVLFGSGAYDPTLKQYPVGRSGAYSVPDGVRAIGQYAFYGCTKLTEVTLPDSCKAINSNAFQDCTALEEADLNSVTSISYRAFMGCCSLAAIEIPSGVRALHEGVFYDCTSLASLTIPSSVTQIGQSAFGNCSALKSVDLPYLSTIENDLFHGCHALESVTLEGSQTIECYAFSSTSLREIVIPKSVTTMGDAFTFAVALERIVFLGRAPTIDSHCFYDVTATAYYPAGDESWTEDKRKDYGGDLTWEIWTCETLGQEHTAEISSAVEATCTSPGLTEGELCSVCGVVLVEQEEIPATGHAPVADAAVPPTCTETGLTAGSHCETCGEVLTEQEEIPAAGHAPVADAAVPPTCTETGLTAGSHCETCGEVLTAQEEVPATGHAYTGAVFTWSADLTAATAAAPCHCGYTGEAACTLSWDVGVAGRLTVTASAVFGEETYRESKEITYSADGDTVTVTLPGEIPGLKVFAAAYDGSGQMTLIVPAEISGSTANLTAAAGMRIFLLTDGYRPISPPVTV